jgi:endogenous inhibitor of DNA gyrase (YacG/DUF329 family)
VTPAPLSRPGVWPTLGGRQLASYIRRCLECRASFRAEPDGTDSFLFCGSSCMDASASRAAANAKPFAKLGRRETDAEKYLRQKAELGGKTPRYQYIHEYPDYSPALWQCDTCQRMFPRPAKRSRYSFCSQKCRSWMSARWAGKQQWGMSTKAWGKNECAACGIPIERYSSMQRYCSAKCKRSKSKRCGQVRKSVQAQVLARHGWWCHICNNLIDPNLGRLDRMAMTMDHLIPVALGGTDDVDNLKPAHRSCNSSRGVKPVDQCRGAS